MKRLELGGTLLAGSLGSLLVARSSWLEADDPLRTTAILLPFLVASFVALGRHARGLGARRLPPSRRALELLGLGGFALALA
ncbi:MAG TPA: hypothetical protein PK413_18400, partial [Thermoanaerobaculia bacterium]|nr:hypothetical protein [Thermoanaerobaculia bacterium]